MARKITMKGRFIQTGLLMLGLSLLIALVLVVVILALFAARVPEGEDFVRSVFNLFWGELQGPRRMLPYLITLIVLAFTSKNSRAPKAEGIPYDKSTR